jgi:hypothetical protein
MYIYHLQNCSLFVLIFLDVLYLCIVFILGEKKKWTSEEKSLINPLVSRAVRIGKPPTKQDIQSLQKKNPPLASLPWLKVKHQVWALAQTELKKNKKVMMGLKM